MSLGLQYRILLVGVEDNVQSAVRSALFTRLTEVSASWPDIPSALQDALRHPSEMHLFLVQLGQTQNPQDLSQLTQTVPGQPILALLPPGTNMNRLLAVQRAGASQVVPLPLQAKDFLEAIDCIAVQFVPPAREGRLIAICGVSGGCGATMLGLNMACEFALSGGPARRTVLLVELTRQMGTLATYLNIEPAITTLDLLGDAGKLNSAGLRQAMTTVAPGLDVLVGPYQDITPGLTTSRQVFQLVEQCRRLASVVILDIPCSFDDLQFETLSLADQVVLVGIQTVPSVRTLKVVRDTLLREEGIQAQLLVINRYEPNMPGFSANRLAELFKVEKIHTVANDYASVMTALNHARPLHQTAPNSQVRKDIRHLALELSGTSPTPTHDGGDRLARLLRSSSQGVPKNRQLQVLHIEDDVLQQHALALHLGAIKAFSCNISAVPSEAEAIALFSRQHFDVVFLDYHLSQGNGLGCLRQLREMDALVPILVVSGVADPTIAAELLDSGADDFLSKENFSGELLARSLTAAVARSDAVKNRLVATTGFEDVQGEFAHTLTSSEETELLRSMSKIHEGMGKSPISVGRIQKLVDLICAELTNNPDMASNLPRRELLTLFLRLFGHSEPGSVKESGS